MKTYLITLLSLVLLDGVWLGAMAKSFYKKHLGYLFADQVLIWPAVFFYIMYALGIVYFVVNPALEARSLYLAIYRGAFLGLLAYGAYDLTNQATIAKWPIIVTFADMAWGVFVTALASTIVYSIVSR